MSIQIVHMDQRIPAHLIDICVTLATYEASNLSSLHYPQDSPLARLAGVEVETILLQELDTIGSNAMINNEILESGLVIAVDDSAERNEVKILGFINYKRHVGPGNVISIGYLCVHPAYRGKGLVAQMMDELKSRFVGICLTSRLENIMLYEKLGFDVSNKPPEATHVHMHFGQISGQKWTHLKDVESQPAYQNTRHQLKKMLGSQFDIEFDALVDQSRREREKAFELIKLRYPDSV